MHRQIFAILATCGLVTGCRHQRLRRTVSAPIGKDAMKRRDFLKTAGVPCSWR
jgi:hypothetical protein